MTPPGPVGAEARRILGRYLRELREAAGLDTHEAGALSTVDQSTVSRVERGYHRPGREVLGRLIGTYRPSEADRAHVYRLWSRSWLPSEARGLWLDLGPDGRPLGPRR